MNSTIKAVGTAVTVAAAACICSNAALADGKGQVVIASFGGKFQDAQREAYFEPFEKETGIEVVEVSGISVAKVRSMVKTGNVEWDLFVGVPATALVLWEEGVLGEIDYAQIDDDVLAELPEAAKKPYGVAGIYVSEVVAFNTDTFPKGGPQPNSWEDVWDVEAFPGKRMLPAGDYSVNPIEVALLADGVEPSQLYPLDLDRAYRKLDEIRPHVVKWVSSSSAVPQALVDGEIAVGYAAAARVAELKEQGAPIDFTYNDAMYFLDYWVSPKGAPNYENAMKFLEFVSRAGPQAEMARLMPYGPSNPKAFDLLDDAHRKRLSSSAENMKAQTEINSDWWAADAGTGRSNHVENARRWNAWITQ